MTHSVSQALYRANVEVPEQRCISLLFSRQPDQHLTYGELVLGAAAYAEALARAGIQPGEVVIIIFNHGVELVFSFFGAVLRGAIPSIMPFLTEKLSPENYRASLTSLFEITAPAAVITYPEFLGEVQSASRNSSVRAILGSDQVQPLSGIDWQALPGLKRSPDEVVLLQHSSGTTGLQKGVALAHQAVFNQLESYTAALRINQQDIVVSWLPLYHDMGLIAGFLLPILCRIPLVLMSPFDWVRAPYKLLQAISEYRGTLIWLPNFAYNFCAQKIRERDLESVNLSSLRAVINCSEPMYLQSHQMFLERFQRYQLNPSALATCYAMAENVFAVTQGGIDRPVTIDWIQSRDLLSNQVATPTEQRSQGAVPMVSAGQPIEGVEVRVLNSQGQVLPERQIGEIALRSHCMLTGYYHRPDLTEKAFLDGWYLTGDLGYLAEGELYITGRKKDLIIIGGKNVYPQDLERLAGEVDGVHPGRVVAFGVFNPETGTEEVVIVAELDPEQFAQEGASDRIAGEIRRRVTQGSDIALRFVHQVERNWLLKTSSGKIARSSNREKYLQEIEAAQS